MRPSMSDCSLAASSCCVSPTPSSVDSEVANILLASLPRASSTPSPHRAYPAASSPSTGELRWADKEPDGFDWREVEAQDATTEQPWECTGRGHCDVRYCRDPCHDEPPATPAWFLKVQERNCQPTEEGKSSESRQAPRHATAASRTPHRHRLADHPPQQEGHQPHQHLTTPQQASAADGA